LILLRPFYIDDQDACPLQNRHESQTRFCGIYLIGILCAGGDIIPFSVQPLTTKILWMWIAGGLIEFAIAGAIVGAIYKPLSTSTTD